MTRLCDQLRQIYASGDSMTVLKLLKELIDAVEDFEGHTATSEQVGYLTEKVEELEPAVEANTNELDTHNEEINGLQADMVVNNAKHLYQHKVTINFSFDEGNGYVNVIGIIYNLVSTEYARTSLPRMVCTGGVFLPSVGNCVPALSVTFNPPALNRYIAYLDPDDLGFTHTIAIPSDATVTDVVTQIF